MRENHPESSVISICHAILPSGEIIPSLEPWSDSTDLYKFFLQMWVYCKHFNFYFKFCLMKVNERKLLSLYYSITALMPSTWPESCECKPFSFCFVALWTETSTTLNDPSFRFSAVLLIRRCVGENLSTLWFLRKEKRSEDQMDHCEGW